MASRGVRGSDHEELERLINSVFDSDVEDSEGEDVQELEDNFYRENIVTVVIVSQLAAVKKMLQNRPDQKASRFITPKHCFK